MKYVIEIEEHPIIEDLVKGIRLYRAIGFENLFFTRTDLMMNLVPFDDTVKQAFQEGYQKGLQDKNSSHGLYWDNITAIKDAQTNKGIKEYGQTLEQNTNLKPVERITMLEEELCDGLMYLEHLKTWIEELKSIGSEPISREDYE